MKYLLDTESLSNLLLYQPSPAFIRRLALVAPNEQCTSSVNYGELLFGAARHPSRGAEYRARIEVMVARLLQILPFDAEAARRYAELRATLERTGSPIGDADTRIAAIALIHSLTVVTGNLRHFSRVPGLAVENWLNG